MAEPTESKRVQNMTEEEVLLEIGKVVGDLIGTASIYQRIRLLEIQAIIYDRIGKAV